MFAIVESQPLVPNLYRMVVEAPPVAAQVKPGQFVIVQAVEFGERIPLSVADWDAEAGTLTLIFMEVGKTTSALAAKKRGDALPTVVGPLGNPTVIEPFGSVVCVAGCYGIGSILPVARALKAAGNRVTVAIEGRSAYLLYGREALRGHCDTLIEITRDGSRGFKGHIGRLPEILREKGVTADRFIVNGCTFLMRRASQVFEPAGVPVIVSLNPIMIDGTGMCGVCRLTYDGKMKFACVDGPDFDGRLVDWEEFLKRRKQYVDEELIPVHHTGHTRCY
jgi:ferredoxin--NADP+ reductase